jgi:hypothetical protein
MLLCLIFGIVHPLPVTKPLESFVLRESKHPFLTVRIHVVTLIRFFIEMGSIPVTHKLENINVLLEWHVDVIAFAFGDLGLGVSEEKG